MRILLMICVLSKIYSGEEINIKYLTLINEGINCYDNTPMLLSDLSKANPGTELHSYICKKIVLRWIEWSYVDGNIGDASNEVLLLEKIKANNVKAMYSLIQVNDIINGAENSGMALNDESKKVVLSVYNRIKSTGSIFQNYRE